MSVVLCSLEMDAVVQPLASYAVVVTALPDTREHRADDFSLASHVLKSSIEKIWT